MSSLPGRAAAGLLAAALIVGPGCVSAHKFQQLESRYTTQETDYAACQADLAAARSENSYLQARIEEKGKENEAVRAEMEKKEAEAALRATVVAAATPRQPASQGERGPGPGAGASAGTDADFDLGADIPAPSGWNINPETGGIVLDNAILFNSGQAVLRTEGKALLDRLAATLGEETYRGTFVRVDGHTDDQPIQKSAHKDNWDLSAKRALAVLNYLETKGIASERLFFAGFGPHRPIVAQDRKQNRRVEIVLVRKR